MIIAKFGGTSVSSKESVLTLCNIVGSELERQPVVVVSALSGVTDLLLSLPGLPKSKIGKTIRKIRNLHYNLIKNLWSDKTLQKEIMQFIDNQLDAVAKLISTGNPGGEFLDRLASFGEIMSSFIIARALEKRGIKAAQVIATDLIITNNNFGSAEFLLQPTRKKTKMVLTPLIKQGIVPVVTGFIGSTKTGQVTTLGRGGSDYTASIIGFCLRALEIQIWTDVDGVFTADPRIVEGAKSLQTVSFKEASELAAFGARVLHPRTVRPAIKSGIAVKVLNTFNPQNGGTLIEERSTTQGKIKAVSFKKKIFLVNIYATEMLYQKGFLAKIFRVFVRYDILVDLVSVSEVSVSVSVDERKNLENAIKDLSEFSNVSLIEDMGMVSLIGEEITSSTKTIRKVFEILDKEKILARMISLSAASINISIVMESDKVEQAVRILHNHFLLTTRLS
ncbi:aspartate kinase [Candidatus Daviesbacteria bacterium]|nr:aspartate kinase [Candidatus Daviesbacteria bacterium]